MEVAYRACAGLDVHKKTVVACCLRSDTLGRLHSETRTFGTQMQELLALSDWLTGHEVTHVAMESTGEYWKPVYHLLESILTVLVVNAHHMHNVPGRKTDVNDAAWIADLLRHGLLRGSFIPPLPQRDLRDLTRQRTNLVRERATVVNRLQKVLEWANVKLASVVSDITGVSARAMLQAIVAGETDTGVLADLARGQLRKKRAALEQALTGQVREHHRFLLAQHLIHLDFLDEQQANFDQRILAALEAVQPLLAPAATGRIADPSTAPAHDALPWAEAVDLLLTIPGVGRTTAELLLAELGTNMAQFPTAAHLASWAKVAPGNHESAGKRYSGKTGRGNPWLRSGLVQAAHAAVRVKGSRWYTVYRRLADRRGAKKAIMAVAHRLLTVVYYMLLRHEPYHDPGTAGLDEQHRMKVVQRMQQRMQRLGYAVTLTSMPTNTG